MYALNVGVTRKDIWSIVSIAIGSKYGCESRQRMPLTNAAV